jgi:hypothetical protein
MARILICHVPKDGAAARELGSALMGRGHTVSFDGEPDSPRSDRFSRLRQFEAVVVLWTENSVGSSGIAEVAREALGPNLLVPVRVDDLPIARLPLAFRKLNSFLALDIDAIMRNIARLSVAASSRNEMQSRPTPHGDAAEQARERPARPPAPRRAANVGLALRDVSTPASPAAPRRDVMAELAQRNAAARSQPPAPRRDVMAELAQRNATARSQPAAPRRDVMAELAQRDAPPASSAAPRRDVTAELAQQNVPTPASPAALRRDLMAEVAQRNAPAPSPPVAPRRDLMAELAQRNASTPASPAAPRRDVMAKLAHRNVPTLASPVTPRRDVMDELTQRDAPAPASPAAPRRDVMDELTQWDALAPSPPPEPRGDVMAELAQWDAPTPSPPPAPRRDAMAELAQWDAPAPPSPHRDAILELAQHDAFPPPEAPSSRHAASVEPPQRDHSWPSPMPAPARSAMAAEHEEERAAPWDRQDVLEQRGAEWLDSPNDDPEPAHGELEDFGLARAPAGPNAGPYDRALAVAAGHLMHQIPGEMWLGEPELVEVWLGGAAKVALARGFSGHGASTREELPTIETMSISLFTTGDAFEIERYTETTQGFTAGHLGQTPLDVSNLGRWAWQVIPRVSGSHRLYIRVSALLRDKRGMASSAVLPDQELWVSVYASAGEFPLWPKVKSLLQNWGWLD